MENIQEDNDELKENSEFAQKLHDLKEQGDKITMMLMIIIYQQ